jgi:hypothetical protein
MIGAYELLDDEQLKALNSQCPHWQQMTSTGNCVDKWWMGPPVSTAVGIAAMALTLGALGWIATKLRGASYLKPVADVLERAGKMQSNQRPRTRRRAAGKRYSRARK